MSQANNVSLFADDEEAKHVYQAVMQYKSKDTPKAKNKKSLTETLKQADRDEITTREVNLTFT